MREKGEILFSTEVMVFKCQNFYKRINAMNKSTRITSDRQIVFDEVMAKMKEVFIGQAQNGMDEHIGNWNGYFEYLSENVVIHDDLNFIDDWSSRECLLFIYGAGFQQVIADMEKAFLDPSNATVEFGDYKKALQRLAKRAAVAALPIKLIELGIEPQRLDDYLMRLIDYGHEYDQVGRKKLFEDCVMKGKSLPNVTAVAS